MMIEPTETESKETMDAFTDVMIKIAKEVEENPDVVLEAPHTTIIGRLDEVQAARNQSYAISEKTLQVKKLLKLKKMVQANTIFFHRTIKYLFIYREI